ncbi:MAG: GntR family transcriptional regulator [Victivallales bacterium]|nr:GntR family transcriptional regulator [Victivallales bacterium]
MNHHQAEKPKFQQVYDLILRGLKDGIFQVGDRLPSERQLAERLKVNIATVRRGYRELTLAGIVEKKVGSGAYLRQALETSFEDKPVTFALCSRVWSFTEQFLKAIPGVMSARHRNYRLVIQDSGNFQEVLASNIQYGMPTIFLDGLPLSSLDTVLQAPHLSVVMSRRCDRQGVPSVLCEDAQGMQRLVKHLQERGHRRIAILFNNIADEDTQIDSWRTALGEDYSPKLRIPLFPQGHTVDDQEEPMDLARENILREWQRRKFTALVALSDELAAGAIAGLANAGVRIPQDVAIASVGNTRLSRSTVPPLTVYDPDIPGHLREALELLDNNLMHPEAPCLLRFVQPILIPGGST